MRTELLDLLEEFSLKLSKYQQNQYVIKLRDYFVPFICDSYGDKKVDELFTYNITKDDIINCTVYYVMKNENVKRKSAIDDLVKSVKVCKFPRVFI